MGRRGRKADTIAAFSERTAAREALELRWRERLVAEPRLATLVTSEGARREPLHRWLPYRQGFSPALVRLFLRETAAARRRVRDRPILDPFSGSGTTVVECARQSVRAVGVESLASLVFLSTRKMDKGFPPIPDLGDLSLWESAVDRLESPAHRAALMLAVSRQYNAAGRLIPQAKSLSCLLTEVVALMTDDLRSPVAVPGLVVQGDARRMDFIAEESIGAVLTSPPYLSRYDYRDVAAPYEGVYRHWYPESARSCDGPTQMQSATTMTSTRVREVCRSEIETEICGCLAVLGEARLAAMVRAYFADLRRVLGEIMRVLSHGGIAWLVVGGARLKDVYVPGDLMTTQEAERCGFRVESARVARDLIPSRRKFGRIGWISPRESILVLSKP